MTSLLVKPNARYGTVIDITPENAEWSFVGFKVVKLKAQEIHEFETNRERVLFSSDHRNI